MNDMDMETMGERTQLNTKYANLMIFRLLEILYDSKGKGAKFRTCILGKEDIVNHYEKQGLRFSQDSWEENKERCRNFLKEQGIIKDMTCDVLENEIKIIVTSCIHIPVEDMLKDDKVPPYTCIPANLFAYGMEQAAKKQTEIAKIEAGKSECVIKMLLLQEEA